MYSGRGAMSTFTRLEACQLEQQRVDYDITSRPRRAGGATHPPLTTLTADRAPWPWPPPLAPPLSGSEAACFCPWASGRKVIKDE
jgi:hypothetical protein